MHYENTLIAVAEDCRAPTSEVPVPRAGKKTVAVLQHEMLADAPFVMTQEDVLFESWLRRQPDVADRDVPALRAAFFAKAQPCLRTSPLAKQYGFGLLFDSKGGVALCPRESTQYRQILDEPGEVTVLKAMRSSRG